MRRRQVLFDQGSGFSEYGGFVAETTEPVDGVEFCFAAKPRDLSLCIVTMALLGGDDGLRLGKLAGENGAGFGVA